MDETFDTGTDIDKRTVIEDLPDDAFVFLFGFKTGKQFFAFIAQFLSDSGLMAKDDGAVGWREAQNSDF